MKELALGGLVPLLYLLFEVCLLKTHITNLLIFQDRPKDLKGPGISQRNR